MCVPLKRVITLAISVSSDIHLEVPFMSSLPHSIFSTDALSEKERFTAWREDMSVIFDVEKAPVRDDAPFHATFDLYFFGQSVVGALDASTGRYVRSRRKADKDGLDAILLQLFVEGGVQFGVGQRTTYASAGDIVVFDLAQPVDNINRKFRHITAMWPRAAIEEVVPDIARWHGRSLPRESPAVTLLQRHIISCFDLAPRFNIDEGQRVEAATLSLAAAAMAGSNLGAEVAAAPPMAEMLTYQIKRYIRENLGSADLSPAQIAQKFGISRTQLYQLLDSVGGISRYQRHLRLQRCLADLQNPVMAHLNISEIAYNWGFKHPATFNRNFRTAFEVTPGEARARAFGEERFLGKSSPVRRMETHIQAEHHQWFHAVGN